MKELPAFEYFFDPYGHHAFIQEDMLCDCCSAVSSYHHVALSNLDDGDEVHICPACVADGSAAKKFDLVFNEIDEDVSPAVRDIIEHKTPGISSWQQQSWEVHCKDACIYLGQADAQDLANASNSNKASWMDDFGRSVDDWEQFIEGRPNEDFVVDKYQCRHCGETVLVYDLS